jgi:predicted metal-binding protein
MCEGRTMDKPTGIMPPPKSFRTMTAEEYTQGLNELVGEARRLGMDDVQTITTDKIVVDERVWYKCLLCCRGAHTGLHCPPHTLTPNQTRELLRKYSKAILFRKRGRAGDFVGPTDDPESQSRRNTFGREFQLIMGRIEGLAFYKGFYLAISFSGGRCKVCSLSFECPGIKTGACLHPFESRPAMEAVGIDVFSTMHNVGWDFSIIGKGTDPSKVNVAGYTGVLLVY